MNAGCLSKMFVKCIIFSLTNQHKLLQELLIYNRRIKQVLTKYEVWFLL